MDESYWTQANQGIVPKQQTASATETPQTVRPPDGYTRPKAFMAGAHRQAYYFTSTKDKNATYPFVDTGCTFYEVPTPSHRSHLSSWCSVVVGCNQEPAGLYPASYGLFRPVRELIEPYGWPRAIIVRRLVPSCQKTPHPTTPNGIALEWGTKGGGARWTHQVCVVHEAGDVWRGAHGGERMGGGPTPCPIGHAPKVKPKRPSPRRQSLT